jgi:hypothetical protein
LTENYIMTIIIISQCFASPIAKPVHEKYLRSLWWSMISYSLLQWRSSLGWYIRPLKSIFLLLFRRSKYSCLLVLFSIRQLYPKYLLLLWLSSCIYFCHSIFVFFKAFLTFLDLRILFYFGRKLGKLTLVYLFHLFPFNFVIIL